MIKTVLKRKALRLTLMKPILRRRPGSDNNLRLRRPSNNGFRRQRPPSESNSRKDNSARPTTTR